MSFSDYIIGIDKVNDAKSFLKALLIFYARFDVIFTTWGNLPSKVLNHLSVFKAQTSLIRRIFFREVNWYLNNETVGSFIGALCDDHVINKFTWGLRKGNTPLGLCRAWDDMDVNGSDFIKKGVLYKWLEELKSKEIIESYEIITD